MKRIGCIARAGMARTHVDAINDLQPRALDRVDELPARPKAEMLREIGKDQPALATGLEVRWQRVQESPQHAAFRIVDPVLQRRARARRYPRGVANHERRAPSGKQVCLPPLDPL